jgi:hypothetical protein
MLALPGSWFRERMTANAKRKQTPSEQWFRALMIASARRRLTNKLERGAKV